MKKVMSVVTILLLLFQFPLFAEEMKTVESKMVESKEAHCLNCHPAKLCRGMSNLFFSVFEIPYQIRKDAERMNIIAALGSGTVKGALWTVYRAAAGVFDIATFIIPTKPLIHEFDAGWWTA